MYIYRLSEIGNKRTNNEDLILIDDQVLSNEGIIEKQKDVLAVVADGMGGYEYGEMASKIILQTLKEDKPNTKDAINNSLIKARNLLEEFAIKNHTKLGSAIAGILKKDNKLITFNVGDCRVYRILFGSPIQLSKDHTVIQEMVDEGLISKDDARVDKRRNALTSAIISDKKEFDIFFNEINFLQNDKIVICSDGFWEEFEDNFTDIFNSEKPIEKAKEFAKDKVLKDNFSFIFIKA